MNSLADALDSSPELFPYALDVRSDTIAFIRLQRADFASASFLDERVIAGRSTVCVSACPEVIATVETAELRERCNYIFHIGHVGSTLLSRLVGAHPGAFSLREPLVLRALAQARGGFANHGRAWTESEREARLSSCLKLLSRTFEPRQKVVVKATSFVSELAANLISRESSPRALLMFVSPESYMATILGGENSRREAQLLTAGRLQRLHRRLGGEIWQPAILSEGETLAVAWACEILGLVEAAQGAQNRALRVDFNRFLDNPTAGLKTALRHFDIQATDQEVAAILQGPDMRRYSKAPEYAYDVQLRNDVLREARLLHGGEIRRGLAWLDRAAEQYPAIRAAVAFAAAAAA
jgi:hypothetical protein